MGFFFHILFSSVISLGTVLTKQNPETLPTRHVFTHNLIFYSTELNGRKDKGFEVILKCKGRMVEAIGSRKKW